MWEAIRANRRRSNLLIGLMGAILVGLGALIGVAWIGPDAAVLGAGAALAVWFVMLLTALGAGEQVLLLTAGAKRIRKEDAPRLFNVVEEMTIASGLGTPPAVYVIDDDLPNAFAAGRKPEHACVAVTSGLLRRLNRDELQGVIAHELAHIKNLDVRFMTIAGIMVGSVTILSDVFLRSLWFGGGKRRGRGGGQGQLPLLVLTVVAAILAPIFTQLLYYACSRKREYLADASAARFTRYPPGLANALEKITGHLGRKQKVQRVLAPMFIVNPLQAASRGGGWYSTHPPTDRRVAVLRAMGGNAGWADYEAAFKKVTGGAGCLDARTLGSEGSVAARQATAEPEPRKDAVERGREVVDLLDRMANFLLIACPCGVRIKVPPQSKRGSVPCTRCGRKHDLPRATAGGGPAAAAGKTAATGRDAAKGPLRYRRQGAGWESFQCGCGRPLQLSPAFRGRSLRCGACRREIRIEG